MLSGRFEPSGFGVKVTCDPSRPSKHRRHRTGPIIGVHLVDLVAAALGPTAEAKEIAAKRGLRAAPRAFASNCTRRDQSQAGEQQQHQDHLAERGIIKLPIKLKSDPQTRKHRRKADQV